MPSALRPGIPRAPRMSGRMSDPATPPEPCAGAGSVSPRAPRMSGKMSDPPAPCSASPRIWRKFGTHWGVSAWRKSGIQGGVSASWKSGSHEPSSCPPGIPPWPCGPGSMPCWPGIPPGICPGIPGCWTIGLPSGPIWMPIMAWRKSSSASSLISTAPLPVKIACGMPSGSRPNSARASSIDLMPIRT